MPGRRRRCNLAVAAARLGAHDGEVFDSIRSPMHRLNVGAAGDLEADEVDRVIDVAQRVEVAKAHLDGGAKTEGSGPSLVAGADRRSSPRAPPAPARRFGLYHGGALLIAPRAVSDR